MSTSNNGLHSLRSFLKAERGFIIFLLCFGFFRTAIADWNPIPSGSMRPTLQEGDVVLVNRLAYDLKLPFTDIILARTGEPRRGDIVTFSSPKDGTRLIKRIAALPGDVVEIRDGRLILNGQLAALTEPSQVTEMLEMPAAQGKGDIRIPIAAVRAQENLSGRQHVVQQYAHQAANPGRQFGPVKVPEGHFFMLGDNRDNSYDSRFIGFVPRNLLIGRAERTLLSVDILDRWQPRLDRVLALLG